MIEIFHICSLKKIWIKNFTFLIEILPELFTIYYCVKFKGFNSSTTQKISQSTTIMTHYALFKIKGGNEVDGRKEVPHNNTTN